MSNLYDIKNRIKQVSGTAELTRAMYLISSSRIRKTLRMFENNHFYFVRVRQRIKHILSHLPATRNKYIRIAKETGGTAAFLVMAADKGMAGSFNHNICAAALKAIREHEARGGKVLVFTVGYVATNFFTHEGYPPTYSFLGITKNPSIAHARQMMESLCERYDNGQITEAYAVYTHMESSVRQKARVQRVLPLLLSDFDDVAYEADFSDKNPLYEPDPATVINWLVPQYLTGYLYGMLVQSIASEHCIRMAAMDEATRNAERMLSRLHLAYNSARQAAVTEEITEIVSGADALLKQAARNAQRKGERL